MHAFLYCQKTDQSFDAIKNLSSSLKEIYPKQSVLNFYSSKKFNFSLDKSTKLITVTQDYCDQYVGLVKNSSAFSYRYYDSYTTKISGFQLKKSSPDLRFYKKCGDYEIDGIFYHNNKSCIYRLEFPEIGDNARIQTKLTTKDSRYLTTIYLTENNYLLRANVEFNIPKNLDIEILEYNLDTSIITKEISHAKNGKTIIYSIKNLEAANYENISGPSWVFPHLVIITKGYWQNGEHINLFNNYQNLYKWLTELLPVYKKYQKVNRIINDLELDNKSDKEKINAILNWVQKNIRYIAFEDGIAGFKPESVNLVLDHHYTDCKGMANLMYFLLKDINIDARRCWVGTDRLMYTEKIPSLSVDNHMICAVKTDTGFIYLDATDKYSKIGEPLENLQGRIIAIENNGNTIIDTILSTPYFTNQINSTAYIHQDSASLKILRNISYIGTNKKLIQGLITEYFGSEKEDYIQQIFKGTNNKFQIDSTSFWEDEYTYNIKLNITGKNLSFKQGKKIFIPLDYEYGGKLNAIDTSRNINFSNDFRQQKNYTSYFYLKNGQSVNYLPENVDFDSPDFAFHFSWKQKDNTIIYNKTLDIKEKTIKVEDFKIWNKFTEKYNKLSNELIILNEE